MKRLNNPRVTDVGDKLHDVQRRKRDLLKELRALKAEEERLNALVLQATKGQDTIFASADGYLKRIEINNEPDVADRAIDVDAMIVVFQRLNRRVPLKSGIQIVVSYLTVDDEDEIE
jgi:hypothetical protein